MKQCYDCPRGCGAARDDGVVGVCGGAKHARIAKIIDPFEYEEPCLGSVTAVFFGGCSLGCSYCQNHKISRGGAGEEYSDDALAKVFDGACGAIDLVTPSHYLSAIERALPLCKRDNSFIYNTSGYDTVDAVRRASAFTDVFLTDYKYADSDIAHRFSRARDYPQTVVKAIEQMRKTCDEWTEHGGKRMLKRGLIIRHLVLPDCVQNSIAVIDDIARRWGTDVVLSLMSQFTPNGVGEPSVRLRKIEYKVVAEHAVKLGFKTGYFQEFCSASSAYTPEF